MEEDAPGELVDGELVEEEDAGALHESIAFFLARVIGNWLGGRGRVLLSDAKLAVSERRGRKPDLSVWLTRAKLPARSVIRTPPDVAIEIVSPTPKDRRRDRFEKVVLRPSRGSAPLVGPADRLRWMWMKPADLRTFSGTGPDMGVSETRAGVLTQRIASSGGAVRSAWHSPGRSCGRRRFMDWYCWRCVLVFLLTPWGHSVIRRVGRDPVERITWCVVTAATAVLLLEGCGLETGCMGNSATYDVVVCNLGGIGDCTPLEWGGETRGEVGGSPVDTIQVVMPAGTPRPPSTTVELFRVDGSAIAIEPTYIESAWLDASIGSSCHYAVLRYDLRAFGGAQLQVVHRLSAAPIGLRHLSPGPESTFDGEPANVSTLVLIRASDAGAAVR